MHRMTPLVTVLFLAPACGFSDDDDPYQQPHGDAAVKRADGSGPAKPTKPVLETWIKEVCGKSVPIQGTVQPGCEPVVQGGLSSKPASVNPTTGKFCVDVNLMLNQVNTLQVFSFNQGALSDPVSIQVTQKKCKDDINPKDPPKKTPKNVALGATVTASKTPKSGNVTMITDGKTTTPVVVEFYDWGSTTAWVMIKLDKLYEVDKVVVHWRDSTGSGKDYGKQYKILIGQKPTSDPNITDGMWVEKSTVTDGDGGKDTFDYSNSKSLTQTVALWLEENAGTGLWETFAITEVEVWMTPPGTTTPPITDKTCANLGS